MQCRNPEWRDHMARSAADKVDRKRLARGIAVFVLVASTIGVAVGILPAGGSPASVSFVQAPSDAVAGVPFTVQPVVELTNASSTASVTFSITTGTGAAGAVLTCNGSGTDGDTFTVSSGKAVATGCSINLDSPSASPYSLTATDVTDGGSATSATFAVSGGASHLLFTAFPSSAVAGEPETITVQIENTDNSDVNPSSTYASDRIALNIASGPAGAALTCAPVTASKGVATFDSCSVNLVGSYIFQATDLTNPSIIASASSSPSFAPMQVTPNVEAQLVFLTVPSENSTVQIAPATFPVAIGEEDAFGNILTTDSSDQIEVTLAVDPTGGATLVCPGVAVAPNQYLLSAINGITALSSPFNVASNPAPPPPTVTTNDATAITTTSATLNGVVVTGGVQQSCLFYYGTNPMVVSNPSTGPNSAGSTGTQPVSVPVTGLSPDTLYYAALDCNGVLGNIVTFSTLVVPVQVTTSPATAITATTALLNGSVATGGTEQTCEFLYGTAGNLDHASATTPQQSGTLATEPLSVPVSDLAPDTTYYFELVCGGMAGSVLSFTTAPANTPLPVQYGGTNGIDTAIVISEQEFPQAGSAACVVLARDDFFSDALAGGPLAASCNGPMLLTEGADESSSLDPATQAEIQRVLPVGGTIYVLGGDLAIASGVDSTLATLGYNVIREAGANEFDTAVKIAEALNNPTTIFEATGLNFYDALSAVPAAIARHGAILLTDGAIQSPEPASYLAAHPSDVRYAIGGPLAAYGADPSATPVYGADLYGTSAAVASTFFPGATIFGAATSADFQDSVSGGVFMATGGRSGPLLIVGSPPFEAPIVAYLNTLASGTQGYVFGGPGALGPAVLAALQADVG